MGLTSHSVPDIPASKPAHFAGTDSANWEQNFSDWWVWLVEPPDLACTMPSLQDGQNDGWRGEAEPSPDPSHQAEPFFFLF